MPECELCGENEEKLYKCKTCGSLFCEYCGVVEDRICLNCMVDVEYEEEEYEYEDYEEEEPSETLDDPTIRRPRPRAELVLDEESLAELLRTSKEARRTILTDREQRDSTDPTDQRFYRAAAELAESKGDIETLPAEIRIEEEPEPVTRMSGTILQGEEDLDSDEPSIGGLILEFYGNKNE